MSAYLDSQFSGVDGILESQRGSLPGVSMVRGSVVGSTISYTLALTTQPSANVVILLSTGGTSGHTVSPSSVTFTTGNWDTPQTITVTITNAGLQTDSSVVVHTVSSTDIRYSGLVIDEFAPLWTWRNYNPASEQLATTSPGISTVRSNIIDWVWDGAGFPTGLPNTVTTGVTIPSTYYDQNLTNNISRVDELLVNITNDGTTWVSKVWYFRANVRTNNLVVVQQGHSDDLKLNGIGDTIRRLVESGYDVIALHMPGRGPNTPSSFSAHDNFNSYETLTFNPIRVFLEPITKAINHALTQFSYTQVAMLGISGGGWTTLFYSAIDTRITRSYPIAGAMPIDLRSTQDIGDYEQGSGVGPSVFYDTIASYVDLYILAASGAGRRCVEIHNIQDSCCFGEYSDQAYTPYVASQVSTLGGGGEFRFWRDRTVINQHVISDSARNVIFSDLTFYSSLPTSRVKVWNGSEWIPRIAKVWNGSQWITKPVKIYTEGGWIS